MNRTNYLIIYALLIIAAGCRKPFNPPVIATNNNYLVVEGIINTGQDSTFIKLSRTVKLSSTTTARPELNAVVIVESDQGNTYALQEAGNGLYSSPSLNLSAAAKYRLKINTSNGKEYLSDYVVAKTTPPIDSITYSVPTIGVQNDGLTIYANTHDPQNNTRYYRWDFDETWEYIAFIQSFFKIGADGLPQTRNLSDNNDNVFFCYHTGHSQLVALGSSARLQQDVIYQQPVNFLAAESGKISHGYSIFLRQYALTADAFAYWNILKTNTEQLGSIFDAQPSSLKGNIHNTTDPTEPVIGFVSASTVTTKQIFVDPSNFRLSTPNYLPPPDKDQCPIRTIDIDPEETFKGRLNFKVGNGDSILLSAFAPPNGPVIGYFYTVTNCADCRVKAPFGTTHRPVFWPF